MHPLDSAAYDDQLLTQYLLGGLPAEQTERLDELSIANDDFAWRLAQIENNLVDDFVRGKLDRQTLQRFHTFYLQSSIRRRKVEMAEGFFRLQNKLAKPAAVRQPTRSWINQLLTPKKVLAFAMASGLLSTTLVCVFLITDDLHLRRQVDDARTQQAKMDHRARQLEDEIAGLRHPGVTAAPAHGPDLNQLKLVAVLLPPPLRGAERIKTVSVPAHAELVVLQLALESADFSSFQVKLKDSGTEQVIWQSPSIVPETLGGHQVLSAGVPANLLKAGKYVAEVSGTTHSGKAEITGDYPFKVVLK